jgi:thiol-disulfide isomerase/thioredoxin
LVKRTQKNIGKNFLPFRNTSISGKYYSNGSLKGKIVFLNFWFEGCAPCVSEFSEINNLAKKYANNSKVKILTFTFESPERVKTYIRKYNLKFEIIPISDKKCKTLNFDLGFPTNMILDKAGKISFIDIGGSTDANYNNKYFKDKIISSIDKLLARKEHFIVTRK